MLRGGVWDVDADDGSNKTALHPIVRLTDLNEPSTAGTKLQPPLLAVEEEQVVLYVGKLWEGTGQHWVGKRGVLYKLALP